MQFISMDMDETLLCSIPKPSCPNGLREPEGEIGFFKNGEVQACYVFRRPGIEVLLARLGAIGELNIFTCGMKNYVEQALAVTNLRKYFSRVFTREDCILNANRLSNEDLVYWKCSRMQAGMRKDLRLVGPLGHVVAVDDNTFLYPIPYRSRVIRIPEYSPESESLIEDALLRLPSAIEEKFRIG